MNGTRTSKALALVSLLLVAGAVPGNAEEQLLVRESRYEMAVEVDFESETISVEVDLTVENRGDQAVAEVPILLYRLLLVSQVTDSKGTELAFSQAVVAMSDVPTRQVNHLVVRLHPMLAPGEQTTIRLAYSGYLLGYVETGSLYIKDRVDREFTILRQDALAYPVVGTLSRRVNRAAGFPEFDYLARITVPQDLVVANGGQLMGKDRHNGLVTYTYRNLKPAWRMDFAIADYDILEKGPYRVYYFADDAAGAASVMEALIRTIDLYTEWFGPLSGSSGFSVLEIPDNWGSQADVTSILQTAAAFKDIERHYEIYHEVSHLWNVDPTENSPRWNEGQAVFLQYLTADVLEGTNRRGQEMEEMLDWFRTRFPEEPRWAETPMIDYAEADLTGLSYRVGAVMFEVLYQLVGQSELNRVVGGFYERYRIDGANTADFIEHANSVTTVDLESFFRDWIYTMRWYEQVRAGANIEDLVARYRD